MIWGILFLVVMLLWGILALTHPAEPVPWRNSAMVILPFLAVAILGVIVVTPLLQGH